MKNTIENGKNGRKDLVGDCMERLTCKYDNENVLRECCTFDRESNIEPDDVLSCDIICNRGCSTCPIQRAFDKLAYYEDLEEKGRLVLFPNFAYFIKDNKVYKGWVQEVTHSVCRKPLYDIRYDDNSLTSYRGYFGNTVFLTEEEAKKELERQTEF